MQKALYDIFAAKMMGICLRYVSDRESARDLLQEGFIKVYTNFKAYSETGSLEGWMRRIFVNTALEHMRKNDVLRNSSELDVFNQNAFVDPNKTILEHLSTNELMEIICGLPAGYRTVFNLFVIEGYSHKKIAQLLNITEGTSRSQYVRAKQILQKKLTLMDNKLKAKVV
ncbi:MAG: sigma-70 family RNA polymerase sigma factor [Prevotellaceae bacterium]|nr:sigma-70 family RNA polymerase sigma factor [Prevotellaceae bacterium]